MTRTQENIDAANRYHAYLAGWTHGARCTAMKSEFVAHTDERLRDAYQVGYKDGQTARAHAFAAASTRYGYEPSILRLAEDRHG